MKHVSVLIMAGLIAQGTAFAQGGQGGQPQSVASITVAPADTTVAVGDMVSYSATALDSTGAAVDTTFTWTAQGAVGIIDSAGVFTAQAAGSGTVVAHVGPVTGEGTVTVAGEDVPGDGADDLVTVFPKHVKAAVGDTIQFEAAVYDTSGVLVEDAVVLWSVADGALGAIDADGQFVALAAGETTVTAASGEDSADASVTIDADEPPIDGNTISIFRQFPDGKLRRFGAVISEGDTVTIGGLPHPFNYLNGMKIHFPVDCLSTDITLTIKIPAFGHVNDPKDDVAFDGDILTGVSFVVSVDGVEVEPFVYDVPIELMMPYKKGLFDKLGISPEELGMFFYGQAGELVRDGIAGVDVDGNAGEVTGRVAHFSDIVLAPDASAPTGVQSSAPATFSLAPNYPNPFNPTTTIAFSLATDARVSVEIYNVAGQMVRTLVGNVMAAGTHSVVWNGTDERGMGVTSGVYFCRFTANGATATQKLLLMK